ncbi:hypothetical protein DERF_002869 [Dermatophagoides farinae]|uniref:Uncharacterized protein n=1 Tax=Dermatophagoides farinae TaxID=6954 RepID=A0A922IG72_DERFA|nr:hypothetical protein DERF_002869 [Dermatophagoides farinae]
MDNTLNMIIINKVYALTYLPICLYTYEYANFVHTVGGGKNDAADCNCSGESGKNGSLPAEPGGGGTTELGGPVAVNDGVVVVDVVLLVQAVAVVVVDDGTGVETDVCGGIIDEDDVDDDGGCDCVVNVFIDVVVVALTTKSG